MTRFLLALALAAAAAGPAGAQSGPSRADEPDPGRLLNRDYLTPTGETVPKPGEPQSSGNTPLDRSMQKRDNRIDRSICSNC